MAEQEVVSKEEQRLFEDILNENLDDDSEENKKKLEEQRRKNKDAEEARKRREEEERKKKEEEERIAKETGSKRTETTNGNETSETTNKEEPESKKAEESTKKLGEQLVEFKKVHPNVDLKELDQDESFKKFISGQLLGKKNFIQLYEDFIELKGKLVGKTKEELNSSYQRKADSSSPSSTNGNQAKTVDVFTERELEELQAKVPLMSEKEYKKIQAKLDRTVAELKKTKR